MLQWCSLAAAGWDDPGASVQLPAASWAGLGWAGLGWRHPQLARSVSEINDTPVTTSDCEHS